jgi:hypothetical protein
MTSLRSRFPDATKSQLKHRDRLLRNFISCKCLDCGIELRWPGSERKMKLVVTKEQDLMESKKIKSKRNKKTSLQAVLEASKKAPASSSLLSLHNFLKRK